MCLLTTIFHSLLVKVILNLGCARYLVNLVHFKRLYPEYLQVLEKLKNLGKCCSESGSNLCYLLFVLSGVKDVMSQTFTTAIKGIVGSRLRDLKCLVLSTIK